MNIKDEALQIQYRQGFYFKILLITRVRFNLLWFDHYLPETTDFTEVPLLVVTFTR